MKKKFYTKDGIIERELTSAELIEDAKDDDNSLREVLKEELKTADTPDKKINILLKMARLI